jgi:hypothetical protein
LAVSAPDVLQWTTCEGRDGWDHPLAIPDELAAECLNVVLKRGSLPAKRGGASVVTLTGTAYSGHAALYPYVPGQVLSAAELFIVSQDATVKMLKVLAAAATGLTLMDPVTSATGFSFAVLNGDIFIAYKSAQNRLHYYRSGGGDVIRTGLAPPAAATVANQGAGAYAAIPRWYRIQWRNSTTAPTRRSNLGAAVAFTPSGAGASARVTFPASGAEGGDIAAVYGAAQSIDGPYYELAVVDTFVSAFYDDTTLPANYNLGTLAPVEGSFYPFPSVKYLLSDGTRLFGLGVWATSAGVSLEPKDGRVYFTPAIGSALGSDDQRIQNTVTQSDWIDLNINGGGVDRGLAGPLNNTVYAFQSQGIYGLIPTGQATAPFRRVVIDSNHGALSNESIIVAEDEGGAPAIYFLDPLDGPRRLTLGSEQQWLGRDVSDLWATVNLAATIPAHGVYDRTNKRVLWWIATGVSATPNAMIVFHVTLGRLAENNEVRGGWAYWTGPFAAANCSTLFATTLAATRPISQTAYAGGASLLLRQDTSTSDNGTAFQAYATSKAFNQGLSRRKRITEGYLAAKAQASTTIRQTVITDYGAASADDDVVLTAGGTETRVDKRYEGVDTADAKVMQIRLGDASAVASTWQLDRWEGIDEVQSGAKS